MKNILQKLVGFSLGPIVGALISFLTVPITTMFISPTEFGKASMFSVVLSLIIVVIYLGVDQAYAREYYNISNKIHLFQNALLFPLVVSVLFTLVISIFRTEFSVFLFDTPIYGNISIQFGILIIFTVIERFLLLSIRMEERAFEYSFFSIVVKLGVLLGTLFLIWTGSRNFLTIVYATIYGQILGDFFLIFRYKSFFKFEPGFVDKCLIRKMLKFGLPLIIAASVSSLLNTSSRFFLRGYSTYFELGIYTAALKISNVLQIVQTAFTSFWVPMAYRWHKEKKSMVYFNLVSDFLLLTMTVLFFVILFFKEFIVEILSAEYSDAQFVAGLLCLTPILYTLSETTTLGIVFSGKSYYNIYVSVFSLIPSLVLNFILVPRFGTIGAAIATAIAYVFFCFLRTYFSRRCGFKLDIKKQTIVIFIFLLSSLINAFITKHIYFINILFFLICLAIQFNTIYRLIKIFKGKDETISL